MALFWYKISTVFVDQCRTINLRIALLYHLFIFLLRLFISLQLCSDYGASVKIVRQWINQTVDITNRSINSLILDCDYHYDSIDEKLVVRWFYNDSPEPVYQWIPESDSRYVSELLKEYFDMNFQIGDDRFKKYRAIRLMPFGSLQSNNGHTTFPMHLAGNYTCVISSIMSQDSKKGSIVFYVPPRKFEFNIFSGDGNLNLYSNNFNYEGLHNGPMVKCNAEGVFPKPILTFSELITNYGDGHVNYDYKHHQTSLSNHLMYPSSVSSFYSYPEIDVITVMNETNQLYSASFEYRLKIDTIKVGTIYECRLEISNTNYVRKKRIKLIYPSTYYTGSPLSSASSSYSRSSSNNNRERSNDNFRWSLHYPGSIDGYKRLDFQAQQHYNNNNKNNANRQSNYKTANDNLIILFALVIIIQYYCWL